MDSAALAAIAAAKTQTQKSSFPNFGKYRFRIKSLGAKSGQKGLSNKAELEVVSALQIADDVKPSAVGTTVDYVENVTDPKKGGASRFKLLLLATGTLDDVEFDKVETLAKFYGPKQAGAELLVDCEVSPKQLFDKVTRAPTMIVSNYKWSAVHLTDEEIADVDARRERARLPKLAEALG